MPARPVALLLAVLVLAPTAAHSQDSLACDAKSLCSSGSACVVGGQWTNEHLAGQVSGMVSWHSDVYRKDIRGPINKHSYCYYRVIRINNPIALPLFWRSAGLKYLGSGDGHEKGCVFACTQSEWDDDKGPSKDPIKGTIEYEKDGQSTYAESWGPQTGWTATEKGELKSVPEPADPGSGSKTLVAQELGGVRVEFETRILPGGRIRYSVRNLGLPKVRVVWNIPRNSALSDVQGPFARSGIELSVGETFEHDAAIAQSGGDTRIIQWQTQVAIFILGGPAILVAIPAVGPSNGSFQSSPVEFWQQAGLPR